MNNIDEIVNEIYDKEIEKHIDQYAYIAIKGFIREALFKGIDIGMQKLAQNIIADCKKEMNPDVSIVIWDKNKNTYDEI